MNAISPTHSLATDGVPTMAGIDGQSVHPMIVSFPIGFLVSALVTDALLAAHPVETWAICSFWLLALGLVTGVVAAFFGLIDFFGQPSFRNQLIARLHFVGNGTVLALATANLYLRWSDVATHIVPTGLGLTPGAAALLLGTGWLGGELAYRQRVRVMSLTSATGGQPGEAALGRWA
ncbi:MAG: DUF2231 domain-containing protein [Bryobacteraceae bacterium]